MARHAILAWLLELVRRSPDPFVDAPSVIRDEGQRLEAIELSVLGRRYLIRVDEVAL